MDTIYIKDLEVFANHGVYPEENKLGQKFVISADLSVDVRMAGLTTTGIFGKLRRSQPYDPGFFAETYL